LRWGALGAAAVIAYVIEPVALGMLVGTLLAFIAQPLYGRLQQRLGTRTGALLTVGLTAIVVSSLALGLGWLLASKGTTHTRELLAALGPDAPDGGAQKWFGRQFGRVGIAPAELVGRARALAESAAEKAAVAASAVLGLTASLLLGMLFLVLSMHFVLSNSSLMVRLAKDLLPLKPEWTVGLFSEFRRVGRATMLGTVVTGLAQGALATIGYWWTGVPDPIFYGAATAVASLVPGVGTLLVWVPVGVVMIVTEHPIAGALELMWGALCVVGVSDYVIRPRLLQGDSGLPQLFTFAALFGGVESFGLKGLIVGPLLMSLAVAVLRLYLTEVRAQKSPPPG
jgi:predicted PurR-regulated permease PerM